MLMKRSRPVSSSRQAIICEHNSNRNNLQSPNSEKSHKPNSFLSNSPTIFKDFFFSPKESTAESIMSPSSILDTKSFFFSSPLWIEKQIQNPKTFSNVKHSWEQPAIGLALIHSTTKSSKQRSKLVVFGSNLKIHIPNTPQSPMDFGIKTPKKSLLGNLFVNSLQQEEDYYNTEKKRLLVEDMELSEDYTCVISHGPNPKTTHIFGNCIVASNTSKPSASSTNGSTQFTTDRISYGFEGKAEREIAFQGDRGSNAHENSSFLSFCHHCNKKIGQGKDIYMYRGEKAFCSRECRSQEMLFDGI